MYCTQFYFITINIGGNNERNPQFAHDLQLVALDFWMGRGGKGERLYMAVSNATETMLVEDDRRQAAEKEKGAKE